MAHIQIITGGGATFEDLLRFVEECIEKNIPNNTPVRISQHTGETLFDVVDMQADEESLRGLSGQPPS